MCHAFQHCFVRCRVQNPPRFQRTDWPRSSVSQRGHRGNVVNSSVPRCITACGGGNRKQNLQLPGSIAEALPSNIYNLLKSAEADELCRKAQQCRAESRDLEGRVWKQGILVVSRQSVSQNWEQTINKQAAISCVMNI